MPRYTVVTRNSCSYSNRNAIFKHLHGKKIKAALQVCCRIILSENNKMRIENKKLEQTRSKYKFSFLKKIYEKKSETKRAQPCSDRIFFTDPFPIAKKYETLPLCNLFKQKIMVYFTMRICKCGTRVLAFWKDWRNQGQEKTNSFTVLYEYSMRNKCYGLSYTLNEVTRTEKFPQKRRLS
jgi:hypothetical protein